jgi:hypothetical protein
MQREKHIKEELVKELRQVEDFIRNEHSLEKKIYYFSAANGITSRTLRYSFSKDVLIADYVLTTAYNILNERLTLLKRGDQNIPLDNSHLDRICDELHSLANKFESDEDISGPIKNIITIGFSVTGPGNYLREKGQLKL